VPRAGLSPDAVVDVAMGIVDAEGSASLTLAAVAGRAGVATPSLYKHVRGLAELRSLVSARVMEELADRIGGAALGRSGDDALRAVMAEIRAYATEHPLRYQAMRQSADTEGRESAAGDRLLAVLLAVLRGYDLEGSDLIHAARCVRSAAHGFAVLQAAGAFGLPEDLDASYDLLIHMITTGLRT
jgi:AcrR family transcriptional regulator